MNIETYTNRGISLAEDAVNVLQDAVKEAASRLREETDKLNVDGAGDRSTAKGLSAQLDVTRGKLELLPMQMESDVRSLPTSALSITVFGRTTVGKSTLMEILTHGDGSHIGRGAQGTTRETRSYSYRGLTVTDVPGIGEFGGKEMERIAFEAARKADIVLFLISDDSFQEEEAECLSRIVGLGKPIICLVNIKVGIEAASGVRQGDLRLFSRRVEDAFADETGLKEIKADFLEKGPRYGQDWRSIPMVFAHLKAAFLSQQQEEQGLSESLFKLSRFIDVENLIIREAERNGSFYRLKSFADTVSVPLVEASEELFAQSAQNSMLGSALIRKRHEYEGWLADFEKGAKASIEAFVMSIGSELKREAASFSEEHFDDKAAGTHWKDVVFSRDIESRVNEELNALKGECDVELGEIGREINSEVGTVELAVQDVLLSAALPVDEKRYWNWAVLLLSDGLMIADLFVAPPLAAIGLGVGLLGGTLGDVLFGNYEDKKREARRRLEEALDENIDDCMARLRKGMLDVLYDNLLKGCMYPASHKIRDAVGTLFSLSDAQRTLAIRINGQLKATNMALVAEAWRYSGHDGLERDVLWTARIPGSSTVLVLDNGTEIPGDAVDDLRRLLNERIGFVFKNGSLKSMLSQAIGRGVARNGISIQEVRGVPLIAHVSSLNEADADLRTGLRLAQQITELLIMN